MSNVLIGQLSRQTGVHIETIRYYERASILPQARRDAGGRRIYSGQDIRRLNFIHKCRGLGFSLKEIKSLLSLVDSGDYTCSQVHDLTVHHANQVNQKVVDLKRMESVLLAMAQQCDQGSVPDCPIIESLFDD